MSATVYGRPARYAVTQRARVRRSLAAHAGVSAAAIVSAGLWLCLWHGPVWVSVVVVCALVLLATLSGRRARADWAQAGRYTRGIRAEARTVSTARTTQGVVAVFCGIQPGRRAGSREDIDVTVVLATGHVVLCEVKHVAGGEVSWGNEQLWTASGRAIPGAPNPVDQVLRQASLVTQAAPIEPAQVKTAVVCSDATGEPFTVGDVLVMAVADLPGVLSGLAGKPRVADPRAAVKMLRGM